MTSSVVPGARLYGFCGGWFGRDSYGTKIVVATGEDWVVARESGKGPVFAACIPSVLVEYLTVPDDLIVRVIDNTTCPHGCHFGGRYCEECN